MRESDGAANSNRLAAPSQSHTQRCFGSLGVNHFRGHFVERVRAVRTPES